MTKLLVALLLAHIIGDFVLQPDKWVKDKESKKIRSGYLLVHVLLHIALMVVLTGFEMKYWLGFLIIGITHYLLDLSKLYWDKKKKISAFFIDQILHIVVILLTVWAYYPGFLLPWHLILTPKFQLLVGAI
ncbi:MAG: DUF3307 domain-containing protein, partial [Pseudopedobacter saltans]